MHRHHSHHGGHRHHKDQRHGFHFGGGRRFASFLNRMSRDDEGAGFGDHFRVGRLLGGGDLRLAVLLLLAEEPRHGYDLIKAIEDKSAGVYSPSPGVIYPALTYLEEAGYAESHAEGNKKTYAITDAGRTYLDENRTDAEAILEGLSHIGKRAEFMRAKLRERREHRADRDIPGVLPEVNAARKALKAAIAGAIESNEDTQKKLAEILRSAASEIDRLNVDLG